MDSKPRAQDINYFTGSERTGLFDELPLEIELKCDLRGEGLDSEDFSRVVAAWIKVKPELLRYVEMMLTQLTRDERVDTVGK